MTVAAVSTAALTGCYTFAGGMVFDQESRSFFAYEEDRWANGSLTRCPEGFARVSSPSAAPERQNTRQVWGDEMKEIPMKSRVYRRATFFECIEPGKDIQ